MKKSNRATTRAAGFTLIEFLLVIAGAAFLASVACQSKANQLKK